MDLKILGATPPWDWPKDTARMLLEILSDDRVDESDRLLAAKLAGDFTVINNELADAEACQRLEVCGRLCWRREAERVSLRLLPRSCRGGSLGRRFYP